MNPLVAPEAFSSRGGRTALSVNLNRVALLRNSRPLDLPRITDAVDWVMAAGAAGITVHPRPDERHIRAADVHDIAAHLRAHWPQAEFNIEGNPFHNLMPFVRELRPAQCTFVPDAMEQATSDHGWPLPQAGASLRPLIDEARSLGVRVSLFMDPAPQAMRFAREIGADRIELYTEEVARAHGTPRQAEVLARYAEAARAAIAAGLGINAGHDLNRDNLADFLRAVPGVEEVSIGHALAIDALQFGYAEAVRRYQQSIQQAFGPTA